MKIKSIDQDFSVCRLWDYSGVDLNAEYCFVGKPEHVLEREDGWRAFRIEGVLDFSLIGVLANISRVLAEHKIGIFVISTYRTDYILTKKEQFGRALEVLALAGYEV